MSEEREMEKEVCTQKKKTSSVTQQVSRVSLLFVVSRCLREMGSESAILKSWRDDLPPGSSPLVKLSEITNNKHESPPFVSGGFNWRMVIYPKGNEEENGSGHVSMYVECLSATPMDVFAYLSFFVFNKKDNKYLSIQDVEVKRFNSSRSVWGLSQALPLAILNDPEKGFLVDAEFGAHVKIASSRPVVSVDGNLPLHKFSWSIRDFSTLKQNDCVSKTFHMGEKNWTLTLYPKGDSREEGKFTTFLHLADGEVLLKGELILVGVDLKVPDPRGGSNHLTCWLKNWVMKSTKAHGMPQSLGKIQEANLDLEDTLNVEIECEIVNSIKDHPFF